MPLTPPFTSGSAIITLSPGRKTVDMGKFLVGVLREEWNPANADSLTPSIDFAEVHKLVLFRQGDWITLYHVSENTQPVTITYGFVNVTVVISLEFLTSRSREHLVKMVEEAGRIINAHRKDTFGVPGTLTGRQWLTWNLRATPYERTAKLHFRRTVDTEVRWRFREVQT